MQRGAGLSWAPCAEPWHRWAGYNLTDDILTGQETWDPGLEPPSLTDEEAETPKRANKHL